MPIAISNAVLRSVQDSVAVQARADREDPPLSQKDARQFLGVSLSTLIRWKAGRVGPKAFKIGGRVKYRLSTLKAFIAECEASSTDGEAGNE